MRGGGGSGGNPQLFELRIRRVVIRVIFVHPKNWINRLAGTKLVGRTTFASESACRRKYS